MANFNYKTGPLFCADSAKGRSAQILLKRACFFERKPQVCPSAAFSKKCKCMFPKCIQQFDLMNRMNSRLGRMLFMVIFLAASKDTLWFRVRFGIGLKCVQLPWWYTFYLNINRNRSLTIITRMLTTNLKGAADHWESMSWNWLD